MGSSPTFGTKKLNNMIIALITIGFITLFSLLYVFEWRKTTEEVQAIWTKDERGHYICGVKLYKPKEK